MRRTIAAPLLLTPIIWPLTSRRRDSIVDAKGFYAYAQTSNSHYATSERVLGAQASLPARYPQSQTSPAGMPALPELHDRRPNENRCAQTCFSAPADDSPYMAFEHRGWEQHLTRREFLKGSA